MEDLRYPELCVALDGSDRQWILDTARTLSGEVDWLKIGLEAFTAHGPALIGDVARCGCRVFLDVKLHDIPATVGRAAANCAAAGIAMLTVHGGGGRAMLEAAVTGVRDGNAETPPKVVAVTVLTSLGGEDLSELGLGSAEQLVLRWAELARDCGLDGVVASAREAARLRAACGRDFLIVTPGIRPADSLVDDQRRVVTPAEAVRNGADVLVVGRPITRAPSQVEAARRVAEEMRSAEPGPE